MIISHFSPPPKLDAEFKLGIDDVDDEHGKLIDMLNRVHDLLSEGKSKWARTYYNDMLSTYVYEHFANEERFMESFDFPEIEEHKKVHSNFRRSFEKLKPLIETYDDASFRQALNDTFVWIIFHIGNVDKKYLEYYSEQKSFWETIIKIDAILQEE